MTPEIGAPVSEEVIVPVTVPHGVAETHCGNRYDAIREDQLNTPFVFKVYVGVIKSALIDGIQGHRAIIAPAVPAVGRLGSASSLDLRLYAHCATGIGSRRPVIQMEGLIAVLDLL